MATDPGPPARPHSENLGCSGCVLFVGQAMCLIHCLTIPVAVVILLGSAESFVNPARTRLYTVGVVAAGAVALCFNAALWVVFARVRTLGSPDFWRR